MTDTELVVEETNLVEEIAPPEMQEIFANIKREWMEYDDHKLYQFVRPGPSCNRVRLAFWDEYSEALHHGRKMEIDGMAESIGVDRSYVLRTLGHEKNIYWILCPPVSYEVYLREARQYGLDRLRNEIMCMPLNKMDGSPDHQAMKIVVNVTEMLEKRSEGDYVQRELKVTSTQGAKQLTYEEIQHQLAELDKRGK